jgi:hypothetical protein
MSEYNSLKIKSFTSDADNKCRLIINWIISAKRLSSFMRILQVHTRQYRVHDCSNIHEHDLENNTTHNSKILDYKHYNYCTFNRIRNVYV